MIGIPSPYLYGGLFAVGMLAGTYGTHTWYKAQQVKAIEQARTTERGLQRAANQADVRHIDRIHAQRDRAEANAKAFRKALNEKNRELDACRVDAAVVGLLDAAGQLPGAAGHPAEPRPGPAPAEAPRDSTAALELDRCRANYADACVPNAVQLEDLQVFTRGLIRQYNRATGRE